MATADRDAATEVGEPTEALPRVIGTTTTGIGPPTETVPIRRAPAPEPEPERGPGPDPEPLPARELTAPPRVRVVLGILVVLVGVAAAVVAGFVAVAPVESTVSTLTWPRATDDPARPTSTTAFLVPYRPADLRAEIPCAALREAQRRSGGTTVLATTTSDTTEGLVVRADDGTVRLLANGRARTLDVTAGDCATRVEADAAGLRVTVGGRPVVTRAAEPVPEVFAVTSDLTGAPAEGLRLTARTPAWFADGSTPTKSALATAALQLAAVALGVLVVVEVLDSGVVIGRVGAGGGDRAGRGGAAVGAAARRAARRATTRVAAAARRPRTAGLLATDLGVIGGLGWWSIVGPMTDDDGFAAVIAAAAPFGGPVSNRYRWFDAAETPFASTQQLLRLFLDRGLDPLWLRTPSLLSGIAVWFLLTRGVLRRGLGGAAGTSVAVRLLTAVALAAWWLPYDLGTRPEPFVALGVTGVLVLVLRAVRPDARHGRAQLALAAGLAGVTVTVAPSGLIGLAPFLLVAPRLGAVLRGGYDGPAGHGRVAEALGAVVALAGVAVTAVFAAQSWHGLVVATSIHQQFGPSQPWYAEWLRYGYLLGDDSWGSATKRLPVLVAIVLAVPAVSLLARRGRDAIGDRRAEATVLLGLAPLGLVLLAITPSKWSHHFGSLAAYGAASTVALVVGLVRLARRPGPDGSLRVLGPVTTLGLAAAAVVAFSGPNAWWGYSNAHIPWATGPVLPVADLWPWLTVAIAVALMTAVVAGIRRGPATGSTRYAVTVACAVTPAALAVLAAATSVVVLTSSFAAAAVPPPGTWSLGARNLAVARDPASPAAAGLLDRVQVLTTADGGPLTPVGGPDTTTATLDGFSEQGGWDDPPPARPGDGTTTRDGRFAWGSKVRGPASVGSLTSPWFTLPRPGPAQELAVSVAGRTADGASVSLEFGRGGRGTTTADSTRRLVEPPAPERGYRGYAADGDRERLQDGTRPLSAWRTLTVRAGDVPPGADRVRVVARDDRTDDQGWVAVTGPRLVDVTPLRTYLTSRTPVVVDWAVAFAWPDVGRRADVEHGVARTPLAFVTTPPVTPDPLRGQRTVDDTVPDDVVPERWTLGTDALVTEADVGASLAGMRRAGRLEEVDTRLAGDPGRVWGRLLVPDYADLEPDAYDLTTTTTQRGGTEGDAAPERAPRSPPLPSS